MNSMSKKHCCEDHDPCEKEESEKREKKHCPTIIKCGCPSSTTIPSATVAGTNFTVSTLTLNTSCLCDPCIKLEFASNLVAPVAFTGSLNFQIFKICRGQFTPIPIGPAWAFNIVATVFSETFSFFVCDCDSCFDECCTYTVVATVTSATTVAALNINNAQLGAIATCEENECNKCR